MPKEKNMLKLGVNVDHVATLRQARRALLPSPIEAAIIAEKYGADGITAHLREDRRHIQDKDMQALAKNVNSLNMEMAVTDEMIRIACRLKPHSCCLVPEKRQELTTEGGLDVTQKRKFISESIKKLRDKGIVVSIFIDPAPEKIEIAAELGTEFIELHTGSYANAKGAKRNSELKRLCRAAIFANKIGLKVNAGHGIDYENISGILQIPHLRELNIGHSIIARAVIYGIGNAVREMKEKMNLYNKIPKLILQ